MNDFYDHTTVPAPGSAGSSAAMRGEFTRIEQAFDKMPALAGSGGRHIKVDAGGTALEASGILNEFAGALVVSGGAVSGAGVTALFAAPPAIGGGTPAAGVFTTLHTTSAIPAGDATDRVATTAFVASAAMSPVLPGQTGNDGNLIKTRAGAAFWSKGELEIEEVSGTSVTVVHGTHYILRNAAKTTVTAMASPSGGHQFRVSVANARTDNEIAWNGNKHENLSDAVMTISHPHGSVLSTFVDSSFGFKVTA